VDHDEETQNLWELTEVTRPAIAVCQTDRDRRLALLVGSYRIG
jgi:hypothetical protein